MIKTDLEPKDLPVTIDGMSIDEKKLEGIIELGDMKPGESKETKMVLEPGSYLMFCNMPGHTGSGMWSRLNVADASVSLNSTAEQAVSAPVRTSRDGDHAGATDVD